MARVVIAYEPVWAIGTGRTATADQAQEVCAAIRKVVGELYGEAVAEATTVQYGGSMNAGNADELLSKPDVDGGLIGGASLKRGLCRHRCRGRQIIFRCSFCKTALPARRIPIQFLFSERNHL